MPERDILKQLNSLKSIRPDQAWKSRNRELLRTQIYSSAVSASDAVAAGRKAMIFDLSRLILKRTTQPAIAVVLIALFLVGGGYMSMEVSRDSRPGDSLYIAKILSERTQFALTFDQKEKARLGIEFAGNRAKELSQVLEEDDSGAEKEEQVEKLVTNIKKEISAARTRVEKISGNNPESAVPAMEGGSAPDSGNGEDPIFSANLGKDDQGLSLSSSDSPANPGTDPENAADPATPAALPAAGTAATSVPENMDSGTTTSTPSAKADNKKTSETEDILKQAAEQLQSDNYASTLSKLEEAVGAVEKVGPADKGEVRGADESASTTESGAAEGSATTTD